REVRGGDAEAARRDLLDLRAQAVARLEREVVEDLVAADERRERVAVLRGTAAEAHLGAVARLVLAAFTRVRLAADAVHRHGERGVRLGGDRAEAHRAGGEALDDRRRGLDLV